MRASDGKQDLISSNEVKLGARTVEVLVVGHGLWVGWDDLHTYKVRELSMSAGERGCAGAPRAACLPAKAMSHIQAWRRCLENSPDQPLLVAVSAMGPVVEASPPCHGFLKPWLAMAISGCPWDTTRYHVPCNAVLKRALSSLPRDADVLYLGYSQAADWRSCGPDLAEAEYVWTTVAYMIWPEGARKLLSKLPVNQPVDNFMALLCADGNLKAYCTLPKIVHQADGWNVKSDVGHSDEAPAPGVVTSDVFHTDDKYWGNGPANPHFVCSFGFGNSSDIVKSDDRYWGCLHRWAPFAGADVGARGVLG
eukprot:Skav233027  [mRNA]  locus=scaffold909:713182:731007:- [translate_table: standard]